MATFGKWKKNYENIRYSIKDQHKSFIIIGKAPSATGYIRAF